MKNKKMKLGSLALALTLSTAAICPAFADNGQGHELEENAYEYSALMANEERAIDLKAKAEQIKKLLLDSGAFGPYVKLVDNIIDLLDGIDLKTGGPRISLAADSLDAILVATRDLTNKTEAVHRQIGFAVTKAVIVIANPFASQDAIDKAAENIEKVIIEAKDSPDITEDDLATVYKKEKLNKLIKEAKAYKANKLNKKEYKELRDELDMAINKAVKTKLATRVTVREINDAYAELEAVLNEVKEKREPIAQEVEAKEKLANAKREANKALTKARNEQKAKINKIKDAKPEAKNQAKNEVDKIFNQAKADIEACASIEEVENIKNIALENISLVVPAIEVPEEKSVEEVEELPEEKEEIPEEDLSLDTDEAIDDGDEVDEISEDSKEDSEEKQIDEDIYVKETEDKVDLDQDFYKENSKELVEEALE